jgi:hypothetical protein
MSCVGPHPTSNVAGTTLAHNIAIISFANFVRVLPALETKCAEAQVDSCPCHPARRPDARSSSPHAIDKGEHIGPIHERGQRDKPRHLPKARHSRTPGIRMSISSVRGYVEPVMALRIRQAKSCGCVNFLGALTWGRKLSHLQERHNFFATYADFVALPLDL